MPTEPLSRSVAGRWLTEQGLRALVALLLAVKLLVTLWNCVVFDGQSYDGPRHARRAASGGLELDALSYNAPTYYLPALAYAAVLGPASQVRTRDRPASAAVETETSRRVRRERSPFLAFLRTTNFVYVGAFYLLWIYAILPKVIPDTSRRTLAALLLLAIPGFQKLAVMPHPDNLHLLFATICTATWVRMPGVSAIAAERGRAAMGMSRNVVMAVVAGIAGLSRPFAAAIVVTGAAANVAHLGLTSRRRGAVSLLARAAALTVLTAALAGSWMAWRGVATGQWRETYPRGYLSQFDRRNFDWLGHLTSFHIVELLEVPNRSIAALDKEHWSRDRYDPDNRYANSLATTLYSETWGDHWLYFSGPGGQERKLLAKRLILLCALPLLPLLLIRFASACLAVLRGARRRGLAVVLDPSAFLLVHVLSGTALFLAWHLGSALTPGKHSSIKFIYNAYLYAPAITLCFTSPIRTGLIDAWLAYLFVIYLAALPMAVFVPRAW